MKKTYNDQMQDISSEELLEGLLGHGMFADRIVPFLTPKPFYDFCMAQSNETLFEKKEKKFIHLESMRNINVPRILAIPNPIAYRNHCKVLADNWERIQDHFRDKTDGQTHKISRIHIRKLDNTELLFQMEYEGIESEEDDKELPVGCKHLFEMNHKNYFTDDYPEPNLLIGKNFMVKADISNCFPSIYTHSIPWALVGKEHSKAHRSPSEWFNEIDFFTRNVKDAETHGILIGPHASNLLSEIVLVVVDDAMYRKGYFYIRNIDDYTYYAETHEKAEKFLVDLSTELKKFGLILNHKKTEILKLPLASTEQWVRQLNAHIFVNEDRPLRLNEVRAFLDIALELMQKNNDNSAILNYVIKILAKKQLTDNAKDYYIKTIHHLILLYPYLIFLMDKKIFEVFEVDVNSIKNIALDIYTMGKEKQLYEAMSYALYFGIKYDFPITENLFEVAKHGRDCVFMLLAYLHDLKYYPAKANIRQYKTLAEELFVSDMDEFWLYCYEVLPKTKLKSYWKNMKDNSVSFIMDEFR